ncbi:7750_t:CDS:1, partial [Paraglomus occultum]
FELVGFVILESVGQEIGQYLSKHLQGSDWKLELHVGNTPSATEL